MDDRLCWIALSMIQDIGPVTVRRLISRFQKPQAIFSADIEELKVIEGIGEKRAKNIKAFSGWSEIEKMLQRLDDAGVRILSYHDNDYPLLLRDVEDAPVILYIKGDIKEDDRFSIAIVGSRNATPYGRLVADRMARELSEAGFTIVSGMARGIDTIAHLSSLKSGGRTIAVLGSGIDMIYPPENKGLFEKIADSGCIVTEFPPGTPPNKENFPKRNRLISGLSLGVIVVEASQGSGALITARSALEQNREVFAVPGNINSPNSKGTNELIKAGARLVQRSDDIIEELAPLLKGFIRQKKDNTIGLTDEEKEVCNRLTSEPRHIDDIIRETGLPMPKMLSLLLGLELKGVVSQIEGKRFCLRING
jgi:DNA processing protein